MFFIDYIFSMEFVYSVLKLMAFIIVVEIAILGYKKVKTSTKK